MRAKAGNKRKQQKKNLFVIALCNSAFSYWKPGRISYHTGNNIDMTQCMIYFTNEKVSRKNCSNFVYIWKMYRNWHIEAWASTQASFITPFPPREHTDDVVTAPFLWRNRYIAMCLQHMGPPLSYVPCSLASKARPPSLTCHDWA